MARTINLQNAPKRMIETWSWVVALDAWDYCDPKPLSNLMAQHEIPPEYQSAISKIISGERKQNKKGAVKLKIPAKERLKIAAHISDLLGRIDFYKYDTVSDDKNDPIHLNIKGAGALIDKEKGASAIAVARPGMSAKEIMQELEAEQKRTLNNICADLNISLETCENLLRDLREKIKKFPFV